MIILIYLLQAFSIYIINRSFTSILFSKLQLQSPMYLRTFHLQTLYYGIQGGHPDALGRFLYFLLPFAILILASSFFYKKAVSAQLSSSLYILIPEDPQRIIYIFLLVFLFTTGLYVALGNYWTAYAWVLYAVANFLLSLYIFLYQTGKGFTLVLTAIAGVLLAIDLHWLYVQTAWMQVGFSDLLVRNLVGAVEAWAIIFALTTIGQVFVYDMGFHKKCQVFVFYISALLILGGLVVWNQAGHANFEEQIGFLFTSVVLLILTLLNVQKTSNIDASNILK